MQQPFDQPFDGTGLGASDAFRQRVSNSANPQLLVPQRQAGWYAPRRQKMADFEEEPGLDSPGFLGYAKDILLGVPRGVVDAGMGVYDLADWVTRDLLPDWDNNPLGVSETGVGSLVQGVTNFATGFVPIVGWAGRAGNLARLGRAGQYLASGTKTANAVKFAAAGVLTDATVFRADQERLSNLLVEFDNPVLNNAVTQYLMADGDDGEIEGRFKNAVEGLFAGLFLDGLLMGLRAIKKPKRILDSGGTVDEALRARDNEINGRIILDMAGEVEDGGLAAARGADTVELPEQNAAGAVAVEADDAAAAAVKPIQVDDASYLDAVSRGDTEAAQKSVEEAARLSAIDPPRKYLNTPDVVFGISVKNPNKPDGAHAGFTTKIVVVVDEGTRSFVSTVTGRNPSHALERARRIWKNRTVRFGGVGEIEKPLLDADGKVVPLSRRFDERELRRQAKMDNPAPPLKNPLDAKEELGRIDAELDGRQRATPEDLQKVDRLVKAVRSGALGEVGLTIKDAIEKLGLNKTWFGRRYLSGLVEGTEDNDAALVLAQVMNEVGGNARPPEPIRWTQTLTNSLGEFARLNGLSNDQAAELVRRFKGQQETIRHYLTASKMLEDIRAKSVAEMTREYDAMLAQVEIKKKSLQQAQAVGDQVAVERLMAEISDSEAKALSAAKKGMKAALGIDRLVKANQKLSSEVGRTLNILKMNPLQVRRRLGEISDQMRNQPSISRKLEQANKAELRADEFEARGKAARAQQLRDRAAMLRDEAASLEKEGRELLPTRLDMMGPSELVEEIKRLNVIGEFGGEALQRYNEAYKRAGGFYRMVFEVWINSLLSAPRTLVVNSSSFFNLVMKPIERGIGLAWMGQFPEARTALSMASAWTNHYSDALTFAARAWKEERPILSNRAFVEDYTAGEITAANLKLAEDHPATAAINAFGRFIRTPTRAMLAMDETFKQLAARSKAIEILNVRADKMISMGMLDGPGRDRWIKDQFDRMFYSNGRLYSERAVRDAGALEAAREGLRPNDIEFKKKVSDYVEANYDEQRGAIADFARQHADEVTWQKDLDGPGVIESLGAGVQQLTNRAPVLKIVVPFIRTPANLLIWAKDRSPFGYPKFYRDFVSNDPARKADALGRVTVAGALWLSAAGLAASGVLTGRGPRDPRQRRILIDSGWQPYSIKTSEGYLSYHRLEPFSFIFGVVADITDISENTYNDPSLDAPLERVVAGSLTSLANTVTEKTFFAGLSMWTDALTGDETDWARLIKTYSASLVPNVLGSFTPYMDEEMKQTRSMVDAMMAKVPYFSDSVEPYRNIMGETISRPLSYGMLGVADPANPFTWTQTTNDPVKRELAALKFGFAPPRAEIRGGIKLTDYRNSRGQSAYDRWQELSGQVRIGGKNMKEALASLFSSREYQQMASESYEELESPRIKEVRRVMGKFRKRAQIELMREFPDVAEAFAKTQENEYRMKIGLSPQ